MNEALYTEYLSTPKFKQTKTCRKCLQEFNYTFFYIDRQKDGYLRLSHTCKACRSETQNLYKYRSRYKMTEEQIKEVRESKDLKCEICETPLKNHRNTTENRDSSRVRCKDMDLVNIDHCHTTKKFRGFLCHKCNAGLGHFKDRPELLEKAARYIRGKT